MSHDIITSVIAVFTYRNMYAMATEVASTGGTNPSSAIPIAGSFSEGHS